MTEQLEIQLLGKFNLTNQGQPVPAFYADRPQTLLAYLLLHPHSPAAPPDCVRPLARVGREPGDGR